MLLQCYFACPLICHLNGRTLPHILGKREGHHLLLTAGWAWKLAFAHKPGWGVLCGVELQGGHSGQSFDYVLSHLIKAGEGWRQGSAYRLGLRGSYFYCRSGWGWKPGSTHKLDQGGVLLFFLQRSDGRQGSTHRLTEKKCTLAIAGPGRQQGSTQTAAAHPMGRVPLWLFHGVHLENSRCS